MAKVNLDKFKNDIIAAARKGLERSALETEKHLKANVGLTDHNAYDLAKLGHPYGKKNASTIHDPDWLVHTKPSVASPNITNESTGKSFQVDDQTGRLYNSIKITKESDDKYAIGASPEIPYLNDVINGTSRMRARNFPLHTLEELKSLNIIDDLIDAELGKVAL